MPTPTLLAVPNVAEGRDARAIAAIGVAFAGGGEANPARGGVRLLDEHVDQDHHRAVFTLAGPPGALADALLRGAAETLARVDIGDGRGAHPHVGALDVVPIVYLQARTRGAACAEALVVADRIGEELEVPVFLYGELAGGRARAELRRGGVRGLAERIARGELAPDFGPPSASPFGTRYRRAGATLVAAREPLVAFNIELAPPAGVEDARGIAALLREGGAEGIAGMRAIGVELGGGEGQVSMNVERPLEVPLANVVAAVRAHARIACAELVGLAPRAALEGFPKDIPLRGFDAARHVIENALAAHT
jgi:glutamate formiminotransferase/glutamate formiminotransferase/formiminotetrahydrofolate cyclodeaminase